MSYDLVMEDELTYSPKELADLAGVGMPSIYYNKTRYLAPALTPDGSRYIASHPRVIEYIKRPSAKRTRSKINAKKLKKVVSLANRAPTDVDDTEVASESFEEASNSHQQSDILQFPAIDGGKPGPGARGGAQAGSGLGVATRVNKTLYELWSATGGELPENLGDLTLREVIEKWGTLSALLDVVKAAKLHAEYQLKDVQAQEKRGLLVDKKLLTGVLVPFVDLAFKRLVSESPQALTDKIVARVMSGGEDLRIDVAEMIRIENSGILKDCRDAVLREMEQLK